ncbi:MAG TPA: hypothetical protein VMS49_03105 [Lysobacter sp.]|nr:hypothetical protein [Lysobacter sp.]
MSRQHTLLALALMGAIGPAAAVDPATSGALSVPANRIVGLWRTQAAVGPCGTNTFPQQIRNSLLFHAGGTMMESVVPNTVRAEGLGTWSYNPTTQQYRMKLQFDRWAPDGTNVGYSTVERQLLMNTAGTQMAGPVYAVHYAADGSVIVQLCGHAVSTRQW